MSDEKILKLRNFWEYDREEQNLLLSLLLRGIREKEEAKRLSLQQERFRKLKEKRGVVERRCPHEW